MKKLFTPLLLFLTVMLGGINALAEDEVKDLTADMFHQWDGYGADAKVINPSPTVDYNIGEGYEGGMFLGTTSVAGDIYADLTDYKGIEAEGTPGFSLRLLFNRPTQNDGITECGATFDKEGKLTFLFSNVKDGDNPASFIHLNAVKSWDNGTVKYIKLIPKPDPLELNADWFHQWDGYGADAKVINPSPIVDDNIGEGYEGGMFLGTTGVAGDIYADLTDYKGIEAEGTPGFSLRLLFNRPTQNDGITECGATFDKEGKLTFLFSNVKDGESPASFIHLNAIKSWDNGTVKYIKLIPKPDPLELNADWWHQWDGFGEDAQTVVATKSITDNIGKDLNGGDFIIGNGACDGDCYADLTEFAGIEGVATPGTTVRFYFNRADVQGAGIDVRVNADSDGYYSCLFKDVKNGGEPVSFVHLAFVKIISNNVSNPKVESMRVIPRPDPIVEAKEKLTDQINNAKLYDSFAKTETSFTALENAIKAAEAELENKDATEGSLAAKGQDILNAIGKLHLAEGYEYLTADMFKKYTSYDEPGDGVETGCAFKLFESTDNPYGIGGDDNDKWADLSGYDKLIVTFLGNDKPRVWINRSESKGQDGENQEKSKMLDMQGDKKNWSTEKYTTFDKDNNIFTVDLNKIKGDYNEVVRLHGIKYSWGASGIITGMYLYTSTDDLELPLENLADAISKGEQCDEFLRTEDTWSNLQTAIIEGREKYKENKPSVESVKAATKKITDAIDALKLQPDYEELTKDMFKKYASVDNPGEGEDFDYNFTLGKTSDQPLGGGNISELEWADLTKYDKMIITVKEGNPRILMNRLKFGGLATDSIPQLLDMTVGDKFDATKKYLSDKDEEYSSSKDNVYTVDLRMIVNDQSFARFHAIKSTCHITGIYLYKDPADANGYSLTFNIDDPDHVVIEENGKLITDLKAGENVVKVADRAKLSIAAATTFRLKSVTEDEKDVTLPKEGAYSKVVVKDITYNIETEDADPLEKPRIELTAVIENAKLYDGFAKTAESFTALQDAIEYANLLLKDETIPEDVEDPKTAIENAMTAIENAIKGLKVDTVEGYSELTSGLYKKYASITEPGEGEDTDCAYVTFAGSLVPYGDSNSNWLNWADLSKYDQLIVTTSGTVGPRFLINRLEENGKQASTKEESKMIEINPIHSEFLWSTDAYQVIEGNKYIIDLKKIVKDYGFARLHSIQNNEYEREVLVTGMYLYKEPYVAVTAVALDKKEASMVYGESITLVATVSPEDATEPTVAWESDNESVATVDESGKVTAVGVGKATITASSGEFSAECFVKCYPQLGDVTLDGSITITDAVDITNYVVKDKEVPEDWDEAEWEEFYLMAANANGDEDGKITFADASAIVSLALKQPVAAAKQNVLRAVNGRHGDTMDALVIGKVSGSSFGKVTIPVSLENSMEYVALQADIILPEGMNVEVKAGSRVAESHTMMTHKFADNHIRVALFNFGNNAFAENNNPIIEIVTGSGISYSGDIVISNILASDSKANEYMLSSRQGTSGVAGVEGDNILISKTADGVIISNAIGNTISIFTLDGKTVKTFEAKDAVEKINLSSGIYVVKAGDKTLKVVL